MSAEVHDDGACEVSLDEAEAELGRLLSDGRFRVSDRQRDILRYLAERRLRGCRDGAKAYSIALDVLGRPSDFDASTDPIVRIEISRLRTALDTYYSVFGSDLGVSVHVPKGSYVALFPRTPIRYEPDEEIVGHIKAREAVDDESSAGKPGPRRWKAASLAAGAAVLAGVVGWAVIPRPVLTQKPAVVIAMSSASPDIEDEAGLTRDMLLTVLSGFQTVAVSRPGSPSRTAARGYEVDLKYYGDGDDRSVWWQVVDSETGGVLKSGLEKIEIEGMTPAAIRTEMAGTLSRQIAAPRGVINVLELQEAPLGALGNVCVLRAEYALEDGDADDMSAAAKCLQRTLARSPDDADALALLARMEATGGQAGNAADAMALAKRAVAIAPLSSRAQMALMTAHFAAGRTEPAIEAGNRSMALNPNSASAAASLSLVLFSSGYWKAASDLAQDAVRMSDGAPREAMLVLALDAYRNGRWSEASLLAEQATGSDLVTRSLRAAALGELGANDAGTRLIDARAGTADFEGEFRRQMEVSRMRPEIIARLEAGLVKAGAAFDVVTGSTKP